MWNNTRDDLLSNQIIDDNDDLKYDTWHWWSNLIDLCGETRNLGVILGNLQKEIFVCKKN
jgi:hypothetical protein